MPTTASTTPSLPRCARRSSRTSAPMARVSHGRCTCACCAGPADWAPIATVSADGGRARNRLARGGSRRVAGIVRGAIMGLCANGALVLNFDVDPAGIAEHDHWHTKEHMPERLSIPGFLRGTRWIAEDASPRYLVIYEVRDVNVLTGADYLQRLNNPSPWTSKTMTSLRGMRRGFCRVEGSVGLGIGHALLQVHFSAQEGRRQALRDWLLQDALPRIASDPGFASAHILESAITPPMTDEQRIRGKDASVDAVLIVTGYDGGFIDRVADVELAERQFEAHGCGAASVRGRFRYDYSLTAAEC